MDIVTSISDRFVKARNYSWMLVRDLPFAPVEPYVAASEGPKVSIPNTVYQTWETLSLGRRHRRSRQGFIEMNPDLNFHLFDKDARDLFMQENFAGRPIAKIYSAAKYGAMKADIFRYCILLQRGGFYFDISKGLSRPISSLVEHDQREFLTVESHDWDSSWGNISGLTYSKCGGKTLLQYGFGFQPGHPLLAIMLAIIEEKAIELQGVVVKNPKEAILGLTGPRAFTLALDQHLASPTSLAIKVVDSPDFDGAGIFSLKGSGARYLQSPKYSEDKNLPILDFFV